MSQAPVSKTILLVDDHEANRRGFAMMFTNAGYHVLQAADGEEGVRTAREQQPDAIVMDLGMPGMDGVEATRALRAAPATASIPIVALTGQALVRSWPELRAAGFDGYLTKPCEPHKVRAEVERLIMKRV